MATDYNKILLDKGYTQAQIDAMRGAANAGASNKDIVAAANTPQAVSTPKTDTTKTNTTTNVATNVKVSSTSPKPEYQGTTGMTGTKQTTYQHQGEGNYTYNPTTGYYEKQSTPATSTSTSTSTPTTGTDKNASAREMWDSKSYQEQQNLLNKSPSLREKVLSIGGTIKTAPEEGTPAKTDTTGATPSTEWDYQDNSPERMAQMVDNLERIYQSNPGLFDNEQAFRNAFINGVNRSPEQEAFLMDYFKNRQIYNEYDGYTSEKVGYMEAHGQCPQSYLNYVKNSNPQRYAEIMDSKDKTEKGIENDTYYSDLLKNSGFEDSSNLAWQKKEGLLVDENGDLIDDRTYHEMSAEEKQYRDEINTLQAQNLKLEETLRYLDEDLTDQYPDADYSTIMLLRSDRGSKIQKEIASNNVTLTKLQGTVDYMQSERQQQDKAGQQTIANLQKNLGMYYDYSPEGMAERVQAQYAATNVTLDQAENGTDTQKQMALDSVLSDYFDKYGSIIQRSKSQVINDVMNYAKKNGVSLSQALQENFIKPLQSKAEYAQMTTDTSGIQWTKIGEDADGNAVYGFVDLYNKTVTPYGNATSGGLTNTYDTSTRGGKQSTINQIVSYDGTDDLGSVVSDIYNQFKDNNYGECGYLVNDYYKAVTGDTNNLITGTFDDRKDLFTKNTPEAGDVVLFDRTGSSTASDKMKTYGHVALVEGTDATGIWVVDANWDGNGTVDRRHINYTDDLYKNRVYGFYEIPEDKKVSNTQQNGGIFQDTPAAAGLYDEYLALASKGLSTAAKQDRANAIARELGLNSEYELASEAQAYWKQKDAKTADKIVGMVDGLLADVDKLPDWDTRDKYGTENSPGYYKDKESGNLGNIGFAGWYFKDEEDKRDYNDWATRYDQLMANLMFDKYQDVKSSGGTFGSMSNAEWDSLKQAATNLKYNLSESEYIKRLNELKKALKPFQDNGRQSTMNVDKQNTMSSLMSAFSSY